MCRNIQTLRPPFVENVTDYDIEAAALQYVRKVAGMRAPSAANAEAFQQAVDIQRRAPAEIAAVRGEERLGGAPAFVAQQGEERPFRVELGRRAELDQHVAADHVHAHARPVGDFGVVGRFRHLYLMITRSQETSTLSELSALTLSKPLPHEIVSVPPFAALIVSLPPPPTSVSRPAPPFSVSRPPWPNS